MKHTTGSFTLPGEAGYEKLTLELAEKWGADVIRDSDGTSLSPELLDADYGIYSTVCIIRDHNEWLREHPDMQQQTFLITRPSVARNKPLKIELLEEFFDQHVQVNDGEDALPYWQVYDRTCGRLLARDEWGYSDGAVTVKAPEEYHAYTVSFLAWRIWEEISMYNHTTNNWSKEHLMQLDPVYPEAQIYLLDWLEHWCESHRDTTVVRFTSLFYNFSWIWGADKRRRDIFTDWASYTFTVSPMMLGNFERQYGYTMTAEDFVNGGKYRTTHMPPDSRLWDWIAFVQNFVADFGKQLVDVVHSYGKAAYVFYDDSWVGVEPYGKCFSSIGFDGIIKSVFSGFESRMCAGVAGAKTHELRLHPYLFPVGLGGAPTFTEGGDPTTDALQYWVAVRRALLRAPVERIGLGGYLHLVQGYPKFVQAIANIADEFREIQDMHKAGSPENLKPVIGIATAWGAMRTWTCCGHYHENPDNDLVNIIESLSGLPFEVRFFRFEEIADGALNDVDVMINAGFAGSAWSGGDIWKSPEIVTAVTQWVDNGGVLLGVGAPTAVPGYDTFLRLAPVLGVDIDTGARVNHGRWNFTVDGRELLPPGVYFAPVPGVYLTSGDTEVLAAENNIPVLTMSKFGKGTGLYLSSYRHNAPNARALQNMILYACDCAVPTWQSPDMRVECALFPEAGRLVGVNNSSSTVTTSVQLYENTYNLIMEPYQCVCVEIQK